MIIADLKVLRRPLDSSVISGETLGQVDGIVDDLIAAAIAQDAYHRALPWAEAPPSSDSPEFDYVSRTPHAFAQGWVRSLRDMAQALSTLAEDSITALGARRAAAAFQHAFPGVGSATGSMRVMIAGKEQVYFAVGPVRIPVRIDVAAVRDLEGVVRTLVDALPKEQPFRATA